MLGINYVVWGEEAHPVKRPQGKSLPCYIPKFVIIGLPYIMLSV